MKQSRIDGLDLPAVASSGTRSANTAPAFNIDIARSVRLHPVLALSVGATVFVAIVGYALTRLPMYKAQSLTYVEPLASKILDDGSTGSYDPSRYESYLQQQIETAGRPDILEQAIAKLPAGTWQHPGEDIHSAAARLGAALKVQRVGQSYQLSISLEGANPDATAAVVNAATNTYLEQGRKDENVQSDGRLQLLADERGRINAELQADRTEQTTLGSVLGVADPVGATANPYDMQLAGIRTELVAAREAHDIAEAQLESVSGDSPSNTAGLNAVADEAIAADSGYSSLKSTLNQRRAALNSQMAGLTPSNPVYKQDQEEIAQLDRTLDARVKELRSAASRRVEDKLRLDLQRTGDVEAKLNGQLAQQTALAHDVTPKLQRASELANDIARLQARYSTVDNAMRSLQLETNGPGVAHLAVAASVPTEPEPSRRNLLLAAALPLALLFGIAAAVIAKKRDPRIYTEGDVEGEIGFLPIGVMPDSRQVSHAAIEEYLLRMAAALERAYRVSSARSFVFTAASSSTEVTFFVRSVQRKLEELGFDALALHAGEALATADDSRSMQSPMNGGEIVRSEPGRQEGFAAARLDSLKKKHDFLLLDAQPLLHSAEAEYAVRSTDATILIVESGVTTGAELRQAGLLLQRLNVTGVGAVLQDLHLNVGNSEFRSSISLLQKESRNELRHEPQHINRYVSPATEPAAHDYHLREDSRRITFLERQPAPEVEALPELDAVVTTPPPIQAAQVPVTVSVKVVPQKIDVMENPIFQELLVEAAASSHHESEDLHSETLKGSTMLHQYRSVSLQEYKEHPATAEPSTPVVQRRMYQEPQLDFAAKLESQFDQERLDPDSLPHEFRLWDEVIMEHDTFNGNGPHVQSTTHQPTAPFASQQNAGEPIHDRVMQLREALRENIANGASVDEDGHATRSPLRGFFRFRKPSLFRSSAEKTETRIVAPAVEARVPQRAVIAPSHPVVVDTPTAPAAFSAFVPPVQPAVADMRNMTPKVEVITESRFSRPAERTADDMDRAMQRITLRPAPLVDDAGDSPSAMTFAATEPEPRTQENLTIYQVPDSPSVFLESQPLSTDSVFAIATDRYSSVADPVIATAPLVERPFAASVADEEVLAPAPAGSSQVEWPAEWNIESIVTESAAPLHNADDPSKAASPATLSMASDSAPPVASSAMAPALEVPEWLAGAEADRIRRLVATFRDLVESHPAPVLSVEDLASEDGVLRKRDTVPSIADLELMEQAPHVIPVAEDSHPVMSAAAPFYFDAALNGHRTAAPSLHAEPVAEVIAPEPAWTGLNETQNVPSAEPSSADTIFRFNELQPTAVNQDAPSEARKFFIESPSPVADAPISTPEEYKAFVPAISTSAYSNGNGGSNGHRNGTEFFEPTVLAEHASIPPSPLSNGNYNGNGHSNRSQAPAPNAAARNGSASAAVAIPAIAREELSAVAHTLPAPVPVRPATTPAAVRSIPSIAWRPSAKQAVAAPIAGVGPRSSVSDRSAERSDLSSSSVSRPADAFTSGVGLRATPPNGLRSPTSTPLAARSTSPVQFEAARLIANGARKPVVSAPDDAAASEPALNRAPRRWHMLSRFDPGVPAAELVGAGTSHDLSTQPRDLKGRAAG